MWLTLFILLDYSLGTDTISMETFILYFQSKFYQNDVFLSLKIVLILASSAAYAAFHLGLWEHSGPDVECLTRDRGSSAMHLNLIGVTVLCP